MVRLLSRMGFEVIDRLGDGCFCKVFLAKSYWHLGHVAIKVSDCKKMPKYMIYKNFPRELDIMHQVHHPHIVEAYETYKTRKGLVIAVMEPGKTRLEDFIDDEGALPLQKAKRWFTQLLSAVVYLHEKDIVHRDINCENIILTSDLDQQLKLMDFSFSRKSRGFPELCKAPLVESCYNAPEVLRRQPYDAKKNDVWSLGITLYAMITGDLDMYQDLEIIQEFQRHPLYYPFHVDKSVREFISYILQHDPFTRPSAAEVALHPWLQTNDYRSDGESSRESLQTPPSAT
ncbi:testis-specific serine/threonine-protein kinase 6-like [Astyanax mexicanus]|uniref:testis-specific serine/threonine-protein kinase 6-like n=1 Tax=Astyanax mexicanus TaxID=7994 RepID=UPI0020CADA49|nr:testis-specific serine/threonine-protein kinase 6-like [Astyanax mexicanus]